MNLGTNNKETIENHFVNMENMMDVCIALMCLNWFASNKRMDAIPKRAPRWSNYRIITSVNRKPEMKLPERLNSNVQSWGTHLEDFYNFLTGKVNDLKLFLNNMATKAVQAEATKNVYNRGQALVTGGYLSQISVAQHNNAPDVWLIKSICFPRMRISPYMGGLCLDKGLDVFKFACSCTNG